MIGGWPAYSELVHGDGDGWVISDSGAHYWGRYGAAGLLLRAPRTDGTPAVLLQHRAVWSHQGGTWGLPGGARDSHETPEQTAVREACEEAGLLAERVAVRATVLTAEVSGITHALLDFRLYLPKAWCADQARREKAHVPEDTAFTTKPDLGAQMITGAGRHRDPVRVGGRRRGVRPQLEAAAGVRGGREGVRAGGPGELHRHPPVRAQGDGCRGGRDGAADGVGDPLVRARLQGPPRLRLGLGRHRLAAALAADPPQPVRPV